MRRRIMFLVTAMTTLVVLAFAVPLAVLVRHTVYTRAVDTLQDKANRASLYVAFDSPTAAALQSYLDGLGDVCAAFVANGAVVGCTPPGGVGDLPSGGFQPNENGTPSGQTLGSRPDGSRPMRYHGGQLARQIVGNRPGSGGGDEPIGVVFVYASDEQLHSGEQPWWILLGLGSLGMLALGIGAAELLTRRLVRPLTQTADTALRISSGDVTARAPTDGPAEIAQVGTALNRLADRIDQLIADERETVADLSHRLRTPMTVLRLDVEGLRNPDESERMGTHIAAMERTLTAVIRAARRPEREGRMAACDARAVLAERVAFWTPLAEDQGRVMTVTLPEQPVPVRCADADLAAAVDALLENVMAHTAEGVACTVELRADTDGARIRIRDEGTGFDPEAVTRGRSDRGSSGLGLDIARRCAEAAGGHLDIGHGPRGGADVVMVFGPA